MYLSFRSEELPAGSCRFWSNGCDAAPMDICRVPPKSGANLARDDDYDSLVGKARVAEIIHVIYLDDVEIVIVIPV